MTIQLTLKQTLGGISFAQVDQKSDIDKITATFDCFTNPALTDEAILDITNLCEDEDSESTAIELFGQENWDKLPAGYVVIHG